VNTNPLSASNTTSSIHPSLPPSLPPPRESGFNLKGGTTSGLSTLQPCQRTCPLPSTLTNLSHPLFSTQIKRGEEGEEDRREGGKERKRSGLEREGSLLLLLLPVRGAREEAEEVEEEEEEAREDEVEVDMPNPAPSFSVSEEEREEGREVPAPGTMLAMGQISSEAWWRRVRAGWGVRKSWEGVCPKSWICFRVDS